MIYGKTMEVLRAYSVVVFVKRSDDFATIGTRNRHCRDVNLSVPDHAREGRYGLGQACLRLSSGRRKQSVRVPIGLRWRLQLRTVGPAVEFFNDVGVARPARGWRLTFFG
jgi:hypothetical protein